MASQLKAWLGGPASLGVGGSGSVVLPASSAGTGADAPASVMGESCWPASDVGDWGAVPASVLDEGPGSLQRLGHTSQAGCPQYSKLAQSTSHGPSGSSAGQPHKESIMPMAIQACNRCFIGAPLVVGWLCHISIKTARKSRHQMRRKKIPHRNGVVFVFIFE